MTDPTQIIVPGVMRLWLANTGTTAPATAVATMPVGWFDVGLFTEDSLSFATDPQFGEVRSAQSNYPTKTFQTSETGTVSCDLQQWNEANLKAAFGGGTVTEVVVSSVPTGTFKFVPPSLGGRTEKACIIEFTEDSYNWRIVIPRVLQREGVQVDIQKGGEAKLPLRLSIQGGDSSDPWYILSNAPGMDPSP